MINVGMYLRLSLSDSDLGRDNKDESNSIESQRLLIRMYLEKKEEFDGKVIEYVDDGYSGTNFNRPAFKKMIEDAKKGVIQVIIVKDLSRFGRDYLGVGDYLEQVFPSLGIRFIALNSNYDSNNYQGQTLDLDTSISNLINSMYSKDISKKIVSSLHSMWKAGINTISCPPYGYKKGPDKKWIIDSPAGDVVKDIFHLAAKGKTIRQICDDLNDRKIPTPAEYIMDKDNDDPRTFTIKCKELLWDKNRIHSILKNYSYTGVAVLGNRKRLVVGSARSKKAPDNEKYYIEDDHPPIVSKEMFYKAQSAIRTCKKNGVRNPQNNPLCGKVICGNCGLKMNYRLGTEDKIYCPHSIAAGKHTKCKNIYYDARRIESYVYYCLKQQVKTILALSKSMKKENAANKSLLEEREKKLNAAIKTADEERIRLYEQYANGHIPKEKYLNEKEQLNANREKAQKEIEIFEKESDDINNFLFESERLSNRVTSNKEKKKLTKEIADAYIESVTIIDEDHLEIVFKFEDIIDVFLKRAADEVKSDTNVTPAES